MKQGTVTRLKPEDAEKCCGIWDASKGLEYLRLFRSQLEQGERLTFVYRTGEEYLGEISLMFERDDPDYTVPGKRAYLSRLIVRESCRRRGIGSALCAYIFEAAKGLGFSELSLGVDLNNYAALKLYHKFGFSTILFVGEDRNGKYMKLLKQL